MPLSYPYYKKEVVNYLKRNHKKNSTILDLGAGDGIWADLLKDYFVMDAVEIFEPWVEKYNLKDKYRKVFIEDIRNFEFERYDIIIMGDVLEHLKVEEAKNLFNNLYEKCEELVIAVPFLYEQGIEENNQYHKKQRFNFC